MVSATDGSAFTGSVTVAVTGDGGTQATGSVGSGACTHEGNGFHTYAPAQAETNYDHVAFTFTGTGAVPASVQIYTSFPQTGDNFARLGAPAGASVSADIAAVKVDTAAILVDTGTTLDGRIPAALVGGRMDANVGAISSDATAADNAEAFFDGTGYAGTNNVIPTVTTLTNLPTIPANWLTAAGTAADFTTEIQSGLATAAALDAVDNFIDTEVASILTKLTGLVPVSGTIGATGNSTTALHLSGIAWADNAPNSMLLTIQDVSTGLFYSRWIEDWADTGDIATVATLPFTPEASVDLYWVSAPRADVTGGSGLDAAGVRAAIGMASANLDTQLGDLPTNAELATSQGTADDATLAAIAAVDAKIDTIDNFLDTEVAAILADTNELQTDWADGGRLDLILDARASQASVDTVDNFIDTEIAALTTAVDALPTNAELATALGTADDAVLAAISALNNLSAAQVNAEVLDALNVDTYAEPGQGTPAATAALTTKIGFLYKAWRNRTTQTASEYALYNDDATTKGQEAAISDNGTTLDRAEVQTGA